MAKDYEIVPKKELEELKKEIKLLKQELKNYSSTSQEIPGSKSLQESIEELISVFREAVEELKNPKQDKEFKENYELPLKVLIEQNEKIAKGILALADILNEHLPQIKENTQQVRARYIRIPVQMPNTTYPQQQVIQQYPQQIQQPAQPTQQFQFYQQPNPPIDQKLSPQITTQPQISPTLQISPQTTETQIPKPQSPNVQTIVSNQQQSQDIKPKPLPKHELKF
ncbi:MAG: hypothetical protein QXU20_02760 [Candidatus Woesearchaeota archaeon]